VDDNKIRAFYTIRWYLVSLAAIFGLILIVVLVNNSITAHRDREQLIREMTYNKTFRLTDLGVQERFNVYLDFCIRLWNVYGYTYRGANTNFEHKAMSPTERKEIWRANFEFAEKMNFAFDGAGYYDVFVKGAMETGFNPNAVGEYGERTWLQLKPVAVDEAAGILKTYLPEQWKAMLTFSWDGNMENLSSMDALKIAYILMWRNKRLYKGQEIWYVSMYHWGDGYLGVHFKGGYGIIPSKFNINNIEYDPLDYFIKYRTLKDAWEMGDVEAGKDVKMKWEEVRTKMVAEERMLVEAYEGYADLKKKIKEFEEIMAERDATVAAGQKKILELNTLLSNVSQHYQETFASVQTWREGNIRAYMRYRAREGLKMIHDSDLIEKTKPWKLITVGATAGLLLLWLLITGSYCTVHLVKRGFRRLFHKKHAQ
jgi:hypothetical protein